DKEYERVTENGQTTHKAYVDDIAVVSQAAGSSSKTTTYFHRDRLGSMIATVNSSGYVIKGHSYDPFGKPRDQRMRDNAYSQVSTNILSDTQTTRGFTDHEHLDDAQLIHMNGRVYDYNLGRFMSVDPFIQEPGNSQSMNPYSYGMNNPLAGTDPSGYIFEMFAQQSSHDPHLSSREESRQSDIREASVDAAAEFIAQAVVISLDTADTLSDIGNPIKGGLKKAAGNEAKEKALDKVGGAVKDKVKKAVNSGNQKSQGTRHNTNKQPSEIGVQKEVSQKKTGGCSFIAGTFIATPIGFREIQDLKVGDLVRAKNDQTDEVKDKKINAVFDELHKEVIQLTVKLSDGKAETIVTTAEHPFMLYDGKWLPAGELEVGVFVETLDGFKAEIVGFEVTKEQQIAYNFEVDEFHTYAVGESQVWVHNECGSTAKERSKAKRRASRQAQRKAGIPTSKSGKNSQSKNGVKQPRHQIKEGADGKPAGVFDGRADTNNSAEHTSYHVEAGKIKENGPTTNKHGAPRLKNGKSKVVYKDDIKK
ncbi:polymorphic toxin-type HINT domain-containing protein, partial [Aliikangiella marina]|uniref:polymorphic toxin-type HINT domain-containing protein n=1 Tax=Aliikangiella marina TaxID=1712262 RepID=UPI002482FF09